MRHYGIIGKPLEHSFSAEWFKRFFRQEGIDADYKEHQPTGELSVADVADWDGFNVTYPYKQTIIPLLDELDDTARRIGAVNTVKRTQSNHLKGFNTDCIGFLRSLQKWFDTLQTMPEQALILGTGGAAQAVAYALQRTGIRYHFVSRDAGKGVPYSALTREMVEQHPLVVQCTPLGMLPDSRSCPPFPYDFLSHHHLLFDCIYNPPKTLFMQKGEERGAAVRNGFEMLLSQAEAAWQIWQHNE